MCCKNLNVLNYEDYDFLSEKYHHTTLKDIFKPMNHPSIYTILKEYKNTTNFSFSFLKENILKQVKILDTSKVIQES